MENCNHKVAPNKEYYCILEPMHKGKHRYMINGIERTIYSGCCPEGEVVKYEDLFKHVKAEHDKK